jgi:hypothetical protein
MATKRHGRAKAQGAASDAPSNASAISAADPTLHDEFHAFMVALATDPAQLGAFVKDPDAAMHAAGISDIDQAVLKSGQPWAIHARLTGQRFSLGAPMPGAMLVVDMVKPPGATEGTTASVPTVRDQSRNPTLQNQGSSNMFPNSPSQIVSPQIFPQVHPQVYPQIYPQVHPQIYPQVHPQIYPQVHPQLVIHPQIYPQVHPQIYPQVHPQLVIHPQIYPQVHPQIYPQVHPQIYPQVHPQWVIYPQVYPQVYPQLLTPSQQG